MVRRRPTATAVRALPLLGMLAILAVSAGCDEDDPGPPGASSEPTTPATESATPTETPTELDRCFDDVTVVPLPTELVDLPFPDRTKVYRVEVRGDNGVISTGVTDQSFRTTASQMRFRYQERPFTIVGFDKNEVALGANWTGRSTSGRWVVEDITPICPGDTEVTILWTSAGGLAD